MQMPGACLLCARWLFLDRRGGFLRCDVPGLGWQAPGFPKTGADGEERKRTCQNVSKSGLLHGLGMILGLGRASGNVVANPSHADASASGAGCSLSHRHPERLPAWHDVVWCGRVRLSRLVAWSQHDWPCLKDWVTAAGFSPLAAVETASNRCRQCARML